MKHLIVILASINFWTSTSLAGSSRDLWIPQSKTLAPGVSSFEVQNAFTALKTNDGKNGLLASWGGLVGIGEWGDFSVEAGADWTEPTTKSTTAAVAANFRVAWGSIDRDGWAVAAGMQNLGFEALVNDYNLMYGIFQNKLMEDWEIAVGGYSGNPKTLQAQGEGAGMYLGLWTLLGQQRRTSLGFEWQSGYNMFGYFFSGVNWLMRDGVIATAGYGVANAPEKYKDMALVRLSVRL